jgi:hypothetical protein
MADPGENLNGHTYFLESLTRVHIVETAGINFLKYPQFPVVQMLMKELNLCAHDHSFVPPW